MENTMRLAMMALLLVGCGGGGATQAEAVTPDAAESSRDGGTVSADMSKATPDFAQESDMAQTPDLMPASNPDMAQAPACGGEGQTCCPGYTCAGPQDRCMHNQGDGPNAGKGPMLACLPAAGCGYFDTLACSYEGDRWCESYHVPGNTGPDYWEIGPNCTMAGDVVM